jgi:P-type Ca2+ transporter type 2C
MWFSKSVEEVLKEINVDATSGLSEEEAKVRLKKFGANQLISKKKKNIFNCLLPSFRSGLFTFYLRQ